MAQRLARPGHALQAEDPLRLVGRRGGGADRLELLRRQPLRGRGRQDRRDARLRHALLAELRAARLRRRRLRGRQPGRARRARAPWRRSTASGSRPSASPWSAIPFDGRSDYVGFTKRGIPAGGVFAGAEGVKTANQERVFGGDAGSWYDPCYHQACDDLTTVLTGVPPLEADGPGGGHPRTRRTPTRRSPRRRCAAARAAAWSELGAAATYATWYFSSVRDPFGTGASVASIARKPPRAAKARARKLDREVPRAQRLARCRQPGAAPRGRRPGYCSTQGASRSRMSCGIGCLA